MSIPADLKYTKDHEWIRVNGKTGVVGITKFAAEQLGDIVHVDLPTPGKTFKQHDALASVESVKAVSDVYAPISGKIVRVNLNLAAGPETINLDAYGDGWMVEIEISDASELAALMSAPDYEKHANEKH